MYEVAIITNWLLIFMLLAILWIGFSINHHLKKINESIIFTGLDDAKLDLYKKEMTVQEIADARNHKLYLLKKIVKSWGRL